MAPDPNTTTTPNPTLQMATPTTTFPLLYSSLATIALLSSLIIVRSATLESDIQVLQSLKSSIDPGSIPQGSYLSSWDFSADPCVNSGAHFQGILCTIPNGNEPSRITTIDLDGVGYDGFLNNDIGNLTALVSLNLSKNKFKGPIPDSVPSLKKLSKLDLSMNAFTGIILPRMRSLKRLQAIDFSYNRMTGSIPYWITDLRSLTSLRLAGNELSGRIPNLAGLWQLVTLDLSGNEFSGGVPELPVSLRTLNLSHNALSGHITPIGRLQRIRLLDLSDNRFAGQMKAGVLALPEVILLNVSVNGLTSMEVVNFSGRATQLRVLDMHENHLRGRLPRNLVTIGNLTSINMAHNQFSGGIPPSYGEQIGVAWRRLYLNHNYLIGGLPREFNNSELKISGDLSHNCLRCPTSIPLCHGGQRDRSECIG